MIIKDNKNLKYSRSLGSLVPLKEKPINPKECLLVSVSREKNRTLKLEFRDNETTGSAYMRAENRAGEKDLDFLEKHLPKKYMNWSYEDIFHTDL